MPLEYNFSEGRFDLCNNLTDNYKNINNSTGL